MAAAFSLPHGSAPFARPCPIADARSLQYARVLSGSQSSFSGRHLCAFAPRQCASHRPRLACRRGVACQAVAQLDGADVERQQPQRLPGQKTYDVVSLGNLCVDVVLAVDELPPDDREARRALLHELSHSPPDVHAAELGGACNFMIAAARLGLNVGCVGQLADDAYGHFLCDVMRGEGVSVVEPVLPPSAALEQTLLCFVLVDPAGGHAFCSRYDFGPWPLVPGVTGVPPRVQQMLADTRALYLNGFVFDELDPALVVNVAESARRAGAAVFFDPGPRCWTLLEGPRREALDALLSLSDVVLMTQEEAAAVTGCAAPEAAARWVLERPGTATQWCVVKAGGEGALLCTRDACNPFRADAYRVDVRDTVGCGDSFAAAVVLGYNAGHSIPTVMALANAVGAATAMRSGAGRNVASVDHVQQLLSLSVDEEDEGPCPHSQALRVLESAVELQRGSDGKLHKP